MNYLRQATSVDVGIGPFVDATDGVTAETGLTLTQPDIRLKKNGGAWAQKAAAQTLTHEENGWYELTLDATDTDTVGILLVAVNESGALPVFVRFQVVEEAVYDRDYAAAATGIVGTAQTGDSFARLGAPAGASHAADIAAIEAQTDDIGAAGAGLSNIPWNPAWDAEVQSEVADALGVYDPPTNAEMEARTLVAASYATAAAVDDLPTNAELATALAAADDAVLAAIAALNNLSAAQVNAEVVDALATDTYAESGPPAATASLAAKIRWLATLARNEIRHTSSTQTVRNDANSADLGTSTISDDGTTFTRGEFS